MKKIKILTHTDFDGAAFPYVLEKFTEILGGKYEISVEYADINNAHNILKTDFEKLDKHEKLEDCYYLVLDIANIGESEKVAEMVEAMQKQGLNFSYIDHHTSKNSEKLSDNLDCMLYSEDGSMSASMMAFSVLLKCLSGCKSDDEFLNEYDLKDKEIYKNNVENLKSSEISKKVHHQEKFFSKLLSLDTLNLDDKRIRKFIKESSVLIKAADFLDRQRVHEMTNLDLVKDYFNLAAEHLGSKVSNIFSSIQTLLNSPEDFELWNQTRKITKDLYKKNKVEERIKTSIENVQFIKSKGSDGKTYNLAVFFAQGDIRYDIERQRFKMDEVFDKAGVDPFNVDAIITFTRFSIGQMPIMTIKPTSPCGNVLQLAEKIFKKPELICGTNAGIPVEYDREMYDSLSNNIKDILRYENNPEMTVFVEGRKSEMKTSIKLVLDDLFECVKFSKPEKEKNIHIEKVL